MDSNIVVSPCITGRLSIDFTGSLSKCRTWIRHRARAGMATHFNYVIRNTWTAIDRFKAKHDLK